MQLVDHPRALSVGIERVTAFGQTMVSAPAMPSAISAASAPQTCKLNSVRVWLATGEFTAPQDLWFENGRLGHPPKGVEPALALDGGLLMPELTDLRARFGEPGFEYRETISSGLRAAAAGGFSRVGLLPFTQPVLDSPALLQAVRSHASPRLPQLLPIGALTAGLKGKSLAEIGSLKAEGAVAVSDAEVSNLSTQLLRRGLEYARAFGLVVMQQPSDQALAEGSLAHEGNTALQLGLKGCPAAAEEVGLLAALALVRLTGARYHASALSSETAVGLIRSAKQEGLPVTADTGICHLCMTDRELVGYDSAARHWPPLRSELDRRALLRGVEDGTIDAVCSDHSPLSTLEKDQEFDQALPGCSTLEVFVPMLWRLVQVGELSAQAAIRAISSGPAAVLALPFSPIQLASPAESAQTEPSFTLLQPETSASLALPTESKSRNRPPNTELLTARVRLTVGKGRILYHDLLTASASNASHGAPRT